MLFNIEPKICLFYALLLLCHGDIELNPQPKSQVIVNP